jgi:MtN3 and saliva related transmembrane protein
MSRLLIDAVGTAAGLCSMASFVPQIVKILRERDAQSVSLHMYVVTVTGFVLWTAYGVLIGSWPVWLSNVVNLVLAATILALRARFGQDRGQPRTRLNGGRG